MPPRNRTYRTDIWSLDNSPFGLEQIYALPKYLYGAIEGDKNRLKT